MNREVHANRIKLVGSCPHCGEEVGMEISKKEVKEILMGFKMSVRTSQLLAEKKLMVKYLREETESDMRETLKEIQFTDEEKQVLDKIRDKVSAKILEAKLSGL